MAIWGQGISLKGPKGDQGEAGTKIYEITGLPTDANASAVPGSAAFATDTQMFYIRGADGWPAEGTLLRGGMGLNGIDGHLYTGAGTPDASLGTDGNSLFVSTTGEVWTREAGADWVDSGENLTGPVGPVGPAGESVRGSQIYSGVGAPSTDLSTFSPPAVAGDLYLDTSDGGPFLYVLGA